MRLAPFHLHQTANSTCETVQTVTVTYAAQSSRFAIIFIFIPKQCTETKFFSRQPNTQFRISLDILNYSIHCICFICYAVLLSDYIKKNRRECQVRILFIDDCHHFYAFVIVLEFSHSAISIVFKFILPTMPVFFFFSSALLCSCIDFLLQPFDLSECPEYASVM